MEVSVSLTFTNSRLRQSLRIDDINGTLAISHNFSIGRKEAWPPDIYQDRVEDGTRDNLDAPRSAKVRSPIDPAIRLEHRTSSAHKPHTNFDLSNAPRPRSLVIPTSITHPIITRTKVLSFHLFSTQRLPMSHFRSPFKGPRCDWPANLLVSMRVGNNFDMYRGSEKAGSPEITEWA